MCDNAEGLSAGLHTLCIWHLTADALLPPCIWGSILHIGGILHEAWLYDSRILQLAGKACYAQQVHSASG